jgi:hypothetical protein
MAIVLLGAGRGASTLRLIVLGAVFSCAGIVIAATGSTNVGGAIVLASWLAFVAGIHRYGRSGHDESKL